MWIKSSLEHPLQNHMFSRPPRKLTNILGLQNDETCARAISLRFDRRPYTHNRGQALWTIVGNVFWVPLLENWADHAARQLILVVRVLAYVS